MACLEPVNNVAGALENLGEAVDIFRQSYQSMLASAIATGLPTELCTIYHPNFDDSNMRREGCAALALFNDVILREAFERHLPVLELRLIFTRHEEYANSIGPSVIGGEELAGGIFELFSSHNFKRKETRIYF